MITIEKLKTNYKINISGEEFVVEKAMDAQYYQLKSTTTGYVFKELSFMCLYEIVKNNITFEYNDKRITFDKIKKNIIFLTQIEVKKEL
ncbi:hypothetical protein [Fusobacterium necrophorum]|jgi:hypothetical protein|uniref:hypothetical protein n=1 Tax=Fusobacterium necrophorum TaxID=859 RepID=UPI000D12765B|nr:hypothetical protein [Fusobacterium necrophorum]AVQ21410.1 hypothetical protein C4N15_07035 [Fusobacterium necrophorum subsp. funduliforme]MDK4525111.1 hypothetical protein [Fusobacterium necrophorum]